MDQSEFFLLFLLFLPIFLYGINARADSLSLGGESGESSTNFSIFILFYAHGRPTGIEIVVFTLLSKKKKKKKHAKGIERKKEISWRKDTTRPRDENPNRPSIFSFSIFSICLCNIHVSFLSPPNDVTKY